jgi:hypothetical protein
MGVGKVLEENICDLTEISAWHLPRGTEENLEYVD